jgi:hypothetical protein
MGASRRPERRRKARIARQLDAAVRDGGQHREHPVGRQPDLSRRGGTAVHSVPPHVTAGVALVGASLIVITPVAAPLGTQVVNSAAHLADAASTLNIPINLIHDIINIPYNEVQAINNLGESFLFTGTWMLASSTNVWGTDPGDPGHYYGSINLFPFPAFSNPLAAQVVGLTEVLLPINSGCSNVSCPDPSALVAGWFQPDRIWTLLTTGQYTFDDTLVTYPDGTQHPPEGLWNFGGADTWGADYGHPEWNTTTGPNGDPVVPWAGTTFTLNPLSPFTSHIAHLMSDPTSPENTVKFPTVQQTTTALTNLAAGLVVSFSPIFPGSATCLGLCGPTYGPTSALGLPFYHDPPPPEPPPFLSRLTMTASPSQNSAPVSANAISIPQGSGVQQKGATQNDVVNLSTAKPVEEPPVLQKVLQTAAPEADQGPPTAQTANGTSNQSTTTSTNPVDEAPKPKVTDDGKKFEPRHVRGNDAPRAGLAGAFDRLSSLSRSLAGSHRETPRETGGSDSK